VAANKNPAYKRRFTIKQNHSAYYFTRAIIKPDIVRALGLSERNGRGAPKLPKMLEWQQHQLARVMARAVQMDRRVVEIETYVKRRLDDAVAAGTDPLVPLTTAMSDAELQRWQYCIESARRAEETAAKLRKELRESWSTFEAPGRRIWLLRWPLNRSPRTPKK
jgi:hypothetical protein